MVMEGAFHADGGEDVEANKKYSGEWCDIGKETDQEWDRALTGKMDEANKNGMSPNGKVILEPLIRNHRDGICLRYNGDPLLD